MASHPKPLSRFSGQYGQKSAEHPHLVTHTDKLKSDFMFSCKPALFAVNGTTVNPLVQPEI